MLKRFFEIFEPLKKALAECDVIRDNFPRQQDIAKIGSKLENLVALENVTYQMQQANLTMAQAKQLCEFVLSKYRFLHWNLTKYFRTALSYNI